MFKHLFGPVPSRRLGISLGIDLVPHKVCSFNCIYCECGPTTHLTTDRKAYIDTTTIINELQDYFSVNPYPDYVTFSGSGEPTLHSGIEEIIDFIKKHHPRQKVAVLTNGSLLNNNNVRKALLKSDVILPSLDAATETAFKAINQPHPKIKLQDSIEALINLRQEYKGLIWLEIMMLPGYNMDTENLQRLKDALIKIKPDKIQLNTLDRPGNISSIRAANAEELNEVIDFLQLNDVEIIAPVKNRRKQKSYHSDIESSILNLLVRRPCTLDDIELALDLKRNEINKYLGVLEANKKIKPIELPRGIFYVVKH